MKKIFVIDWCLLLAFVLTALSGIKLHWVRHASWHGGCRPWADFHMWVGLTFAVLMVMHIHTHWSWYKGWISKGLGKKSRITALLSILSVVECTTGMVMLFADCPRRGIGLWHWGIGIVLTIICLWHIVKRFPILRKSIGR